MYHGPELHGCRFPMSTGHHCHPDRPDPVSPPGDVITFDNWRLLHGRRSYEAGTEITRHLEGAYADWDVVLSRLRILRQGLGARG